MTPQHERLIKDNPNLNCPALSRLTGLNSKTIYSAKTRLNAHGHYQHKGYGIPLVTLDISSGINYKVRFNSKSIFNGRFDGAIENLDRLIYCLESNNGKLPPALEESVFNGLGFIES